ncbi:methyltransferase cognate corrinoid protein [Desulfosporosinus orientis DSM 765]|uniref:Methyltransferase cognate corrinoid protein n=1 Tax=Desulfosporosinus orientis (strain ATCC 19365 / DSM 765 / NCIMB 8382 / VKM B-1628 / Singapore I) TaxID=768706 RepID=G7WBC8_DESOD|nr:corrinoid protein [Desulfosporosinus orientis]AET68257.1 methyltransferase cognate corrinoid protein [Desulfosporosinus orientis DSM 765]
MSDFIKLAEAVFRGDFGGAGQITKELIDNGTDPLAIINQGLIAGMDIVAPKFKAGEMFVPEVMMAARAMAVGMELLKPLINDVDIPSKGTVLIGTVAGDLHDIGKNLVAMILESGGFKVVDLGVDVSVEKFVEAAKQYNPQVIGMSALLTTTMVAMKDTIDALREAGLRNNLKIIVGGAPLSQEFSDQIGADGYASDAMAAKELCEKLVG